MQLSFKHSSTENSTLAFTMFLT